MHFVQVERCKFLNGKAVQHHLDVHNVVGVLVAVNVGQHHVVDVVQMCLVNHFAHLQKIPCATFVLAVGHVVWVVHRVYSARAFCVQVQGAPFAVASNKQFLFVVDGKLSAKSYTFGKGGPSVDGNNFVKLWHAKNLNFPFGKYPKGIGGVSHCVGINFQFGGVQSRDVLELLHHVVDAHVVAKVHFGKLHFVRHFVVVVHVLSSLCRYQHPPHCTCIFTFQVYAKDYTKLS